MEWVEQMKYHIAFSRNHWSVLVLNRSLYSITCNIIMLSETLSETFFNSFRTEYTLTELAIYRDVTMSLIVCIVCICNLDQTFKYGAYIFLSENVSDF